MKLRMPTKGTSALSIRLRETGRPPHLDFLCLSDKKGSRPPQERRDDRYRHKYGANCEPPLGDAIGQDDRSADNHGAATREKPECERAHGIEFAQAEGQASLCGFEIEARKQSQERKK
jgi:hypothetical protein